MNTNIPSTMLRASFTPNTRSFQRAPFCRNFHVHRTARPHFSTNFHTSRYGATIFKVAKSTSNIPPQYRAKHSTSLTYQQKHQRRPHQFHAPMSARRKVYGRKESLFLVGGICFCIGFGFYWRWEGQKEMEGESGEVLIEEARVSGKEGKDIVEKV